MVFKTLIDAIPRIKQPRGVPRKRPDKVHADRAYDFNVRRSGGGASSSALRVEVETQAESEPSPPGRGTDAGLAQSDASPSRSL